MADFNFTSFSTRVQSYQDNGRVIMKGCDNGTPLTQEWSFTSSKNLTQNLHISKSALSPLSYILWQQEQNNKNFLHWPYCECAQAYSLYDCRWILSWKGSHWCAKCTIPLPLGYWKFKLLQIKSQNLTPMAPFITAADNCFEFFLYIYIFFKKIRFDISCESSARQRTHMKYQALISLKDKIKTNESVVCCNEGSCMCVEQFCEQYLISYFQCLEFYSKSCTFESPQKVTWYTKYVNVTIILLHWNHQFADFANTSMELVSPYFVM